MPRALSLGSLPGRPLLPFELAFVIAALGCGQEAQSPTVPEGEPALALAANTIAEQLCPKPHEADANWLRHPETPKGDSGDNLDRLSFVPHLGI